MIRRRFLSGLAGVAATPRANRLAAQERRTVFVATQGMERLASVGTVYRRAYSGCADPGKSGLLTGMYAHAGTIPRDQTLEGLLGTAGHTLRFVEGMLPNEALLPGRIAVCAGEAAALDGGFREDGVRMPLAMLVPGLPSGVFDRLVSSVDVTPTILAACGIEPPESMHGRNLLSDPMEYVCLEGRIGKPGEWRAIVRGYDKLVVDKKGEVTHFFNLSEDSGEADNLAHHYDKSAQIRRTTDELKALLAIWRRRTKDGITPSGLKKRGK